MTPLDSSHLEVFLRIFFIFLNLNLNFEFGPVWYRSKPEPDRTGNRSNRTGSHRSCKPCCGRGGAAGRGCGRADGRQPPRNPIGCGGLKLEEAAAHGPRGHEVTKRQRSNAVASQSLESRRRPRVCNSSGCRRSVVWPWRGSELEVFSTAQPRQP